MSDFRIEPSGDMAIVVTRTFRTTADRLHGAHLDTDQVARWLGGPDMPLLACKIDATEGGSADYRWALEHGGTMTLKIRFEKIAPGLIIHHEIYDPDWTDGAARVKTEFDDQGDGRAQLRMTATYSSPAARDRVMQSGMSAGLAAAFDRLDGLL